MTTQFSFSDVGSPSTDSANTVVSIEDLETLEAIESHSDLEDARKALADAKKNGTSSWVSVKKNLGL